MPPIQTPAEAARRIKQLEAMVRELRHVADHQRAIADAERRAANHAREDARTAWKLAAWGGQQRSQPRATQRHGEA
jgi:hypothetical protein